MPLQQPVNGIVTSTVLAPPQVGLQWQGSFGVFYYDLYRSLSSLQVGTKINVLPLHGGPTLIVQTTDDGIATISPPPVGQTVYYRLVAVDAVGDHSIVSDALAVILEGTEFVQDPVLGTIIQALRSDPTLLGMVGGDPGQIRFHKRIKETGDVYPFVVLWRVDWKENPKFKDLRMGTLTYKISVVNNASSSQTVVNTLNRIAKLLDGDPGKSIFDGSPSVMVLMSMFMGGGPESFSEAPKLWFQEATLKLEVQLLDT